MIAGNDLNVASLNRDVDKAYEITRDEEQRTDLYVTKSSLEAVSQPTTTAKEWTNQLLTYNETARKNYEDAAQGLTRAVNKIESTLGRKMDSGALGLMGAEFAESTMDSLLQSGMTRDQAMKLMGDKAFQEQVVAQIAHTAGIDFKEVEGLDQTLQASSKPNGPGAYELPDIPVTDSDKETLTLAQDTLRSMANVNVYLQNHPEQQEAVSVLVALTQGPKGLVQLAIFNAVSETPAGEAFNNKIAEYTKALGEQVASAMEGETLSENDGYDKYLIGGGLFVTAVLTGVLTSGKYKAKSKTISAEMKADPYHPDWKNYSGTDRGVGADRVNAESGAKGVSGSTLTRDELISGLPVGTKITPENVVDIRRLPDGRTVWLENGTDAAGLQHIYKRHEVDFINKGISRDDIPNVVMNALERGEVVGTNGSANVYRITYNGVEQNIAVGVGSNGFVVRANPVSFWKPLP